MGHFQELLQDFFDRANVRIQKLSEHWRQHTNRRTVLTIVIVGTLTTYFYINYIQPPDNFPLNTLVTIPEGATLSSAADILQKADVVRSATALEITVRILGQDRDVHAGDYLFKEPRDVVSIARAVLTGAFGLEPERIRVPEGATVKEISAIFSNRLQRFDADRFVKAATSQEGYLFPDTYFFLPNATDQKVLETMRQSFDMKITTIQSAVLASGRSLKDIVTMASLLEREAENTKDRRMIAGVLWNRINKGMLLQVDAAFLYTLGRSTFQLTTKDLQSDSPYNTYKYKGLPPTPIGSPSLDSLLAAATPIKSNYLFYLADNNHITHYSRTYAEHQRQKELYLGN